MSETAPAAPRGWRAVPEVGTVLGIRIVGLVYRLLGRRVAQLLVWWITLFYALAAGGARRASREYLSRMGLPASFGAVHAHFFTFGCVALDRLVLMLGRASRELVIERHGHEHVVAVTSPEGSADPNTKPRGCILLGSHIGSFEAMRALTVDATLTVIVDFRNAQRITRVLTELAPNAKLKVIGLDPTRATSMLDVRACIDRGELVAVLGDRLERDGARAVTVDFLGGRAKLPTGPYLLAHMLACPVYFVAGLYTAPNRYDLFFKPFADAVKLPRKGREEAAQEYAQKYARELEDFARRAPYNWFNFYDFWLHGGEPHAAPVRGT
jgi:predicted LPLAT superfamily acyltransferase